MRERKIWHFRIGTCRHLLLDWERARAEKLTLWSESDMEALLDFIRRKLHGSCACGNWWQASFCEKIRRIRQYRRSADRPVLRWGAPRLLPLWLFAALVRIGFMKP